jgi:tRNA(Ile)-lysidine synthase
MARPLLGARRAELRDYLAKRGVEWIEDPANTNTVYARVRARSTLAALEGQGLDPMRLAALAERMAPRAEALDAAARALIARAATFDDETIMIDRAAWRAAAPVRQRALAVSLAAAGGAERAPGDDQTAALDAQMLGDGFRGATLSGAVVSVSRSGWRLTRDAGALAGRADGARPLAPLKLTPSAQTVWDRRLALHATAPGWSVIVENGAPVLSNGDARAGIGEAGPKWLLAERVSHLLGSAN